MSFELDFIYVSYFRVLQVRVNSRAPKQCAPWRHLDGTTTWPSTVSAGPSNRRRHPLGNQRAAPTAADVAAATLNVRLLRRATRR